MAARSSSVLRRALLYVPASSPRMLEKSLGLTVDSIAYDLEDSVTPSAKPQARSALRAHLSSISSSSPGKPPRASELAVRINAISTPYALDDLTTLLSSSSSSSSQPDSSAADNIDALVIPKVNSASDLTYVNDVLRHLSPERHPRSSTSSSSSSSSPSPQTAQKPPIRILALVESARAVMDLSSICAASPYLSGLVFAAEDFALDLSLTRTPSLTEFLYARSAVATAARAAGLDSTIDLVCTGYRRGGGGGDGDGDGDEAVAARLEAECRGGKGLGFNGKQCIHPSQVETVQRLFAPGEAEVEWAVRVVVADEKAAAAGRGAWTLDGAMIDAPVTGKAAAIVDKARRCGMDVDGLRERWKDQEPE
ncbi:beta subunit of citrate lyase [Xylariomycetidae sp. FL2044]|nr:beta subunit of citrate lyase [Xylariomycetidae sp. FL2044]